MSSAKWRQFYLGLNMLIHSVACPILILIAIAIVTMVFIIINDINDLGIHSIIHEQGRMQIVKWKALPHSPEDIRLGLMHLMYFLLNSEYTTTVITKTHKDITQCLVCIYVMMTSSNGNIFRVTGHLCGEFTGPGEFPTQRPVTRSFDVSLDLRLNKRLSKQPWGWGFETPTYSLLRQCNVLGKHLLNGHAEGSIHFCLCNIST